MANILLRGATVTPQFRDALMEAANRAGISANEFVIVAAAEKLARSGASFPGVFRSDDLDALPFVLPIVRASARLSQEVVRR